MILALDHLDRISITRTGDGTEYFALLVQANGEDAPLATTCWQGIGPTVIGAIEAAMSAEPYQSGMRRKYEAKHETEVATAAIGSAEELDF